MGTTGIIFGAIIAAWLAYLVPMMIRRNQHAGPVADPTTRFADVQIISETTEDEDADVEVSTPLTRRAAITEIARAERRAAARRRNVLAFLGLALFTLLVLAGMGELPWWTAAVPGGLIVAFLVVARFSVTAMHRQFDARLAEIAAGDEEETLLIRREELAGSQPSRSEAGVVESVEMGAPKGTPGTLWEPLPITRPTYVQTPVAPRTVRTIDLSAPVSASEPVVAERDEQVARPVAETEQQRPRAVGE